MNAPVCTPSSLCFRFLVLMDPSRFVCFLFAFNPVLTIAFWHFLLLQFNFNVSLALHLPSLILLTKMLMKTDGKCAFVCIFSSFGDMKCLEKECRLMVFMSHFNRDFNMKTNIVFDVKRSLAATTSRKIRVDSKEALFRQYDLDDK